MDTQGLIFTYLNIPVTERDLKGQIWSSTYFQLLPLPETLPFGVSEGGGQWDGAEFYLFKQNIDSFLAKREEVQWQLGGAWKRIYNALAPDLEAIAQRQKEVQEIEEAREEIIASKQKQLEERVKAGTLTEDDMLKEWKTFLNDVYEMF